MKSTPKTSDKKTTNGDHDGMLKVIQHAVTIAKFWSDHSQQLQINQKMATMEEEEYWVVYKRASICSPSICFFLSFEGFKKLGLPPKKNGANLWAGPPTSDLTQRSSLITPIASDICRASQNYLCTVRSLICLWHLPPQMRNQRGLNEKKPYRKKRNLSILSQVKWTCG